MKTNTVNEIRFLAKESIRLKQFINVKLPQIIDDYKNRRKKSTSTVTGSRRATPYKALIFVYHINLLRERMAIVACTLTLFQITKSYLNISWPI